MPCIGLCTRTVPYEKVYKMKSTELKKHVMEKCQELGDTDDVDLVKVLNEFIDELDNNKNFERINSMLLSLKKNVSNNTRIELINLIEETIAFVKKARGCWVRSQSILEESQTVKKKIKVFYEKNKKELKNKTGQKEFVKLFYKLISLILLKYGFLSEPNNN